MAGKFGVSEFGVDVGEAIDRYVGMLRRTVNLRSLVIMGSRARGDWKPWSDTDIVVIAEGLPTSRRKLLGVLYPREIVGIGLEVRTYTPKEFLNSLVALDLTALDAMTDGRIVYDDGFWREAREAFEMVKRSYRLKRIRDGWIAEEPV